MRAVAAVRVGLHLLARCSKRPSGKAAASEGRGGTNRTSCGLFASLLVQSLGDSVCLEKAPCR